MKFEVFVQDGRKITFSGVTYAKWLKPIPPLHIRSRIHDGVLRIRAFDGQGYLLFFGETSVKETENDDLPTTKVVNQLTEAEANGKQTRIIDGEKYIVAAYGGQGVSEAAEWPHRTN
jgi:hypothetical protein